MAHSKGSSPHMALGRVGEEAAVRFLRGAGIRILARNWRPEGAAGRLELDIVGEERGVLLFVEVKTRTAAFSGRAEEQSGFGPQAGFTQAKRRKFVQAARLFLTQAGMWHKPCRFDLVCVTVLPQRKTELEHHIHVIELDSAVGGGNASWQPW